MEAKEIFEPIVTVPLIITKLIILVKMHHMSQPININLEEEFMIEKIITL